MSPTWPQLGPQNKLRSLDIDPKNRSNFELLLGSSLDPKIDPKTTPKSIKNRSKIDLKRKPEENTRKSKNEQPSSVFACFFNVCGGQFFIKNRSKIGSKVDQTNDAQNDRFWERFWIDFGAILGVKNAPKSIKNGIKNKSDFKPKTDPRPPTVDGGAGSLGTPLALSRPVSETN